MPSETTVERIVDAAQVLVQQRGFHAFSFRDVSAQVGIRTASIHYHFPTKADLAQAVLARTRANFEAALARIDAATLTPTEQLQQFAGIFLETYGDGDRLCPFCMIAMGQDTVPDAVRAQVEAFWLKAEAWLQAVLRAGAAAGEFAVAGARIPTVAATIVAGLEGGMVIARAFRDRARLVAAGDFLIGAVLAPGYAVPSLATRAGEFRASAAVK